MLHCPPGPKVLATRSVHRILRTLERCQQRLRLGSLSTRVFETRTATGSELFSLLTFLHTTTFTLLSIFSPLEMNSIKIWETIRSKNANCSLPVAVRVSKTRVLKLPKLSVLIHCGNNSGLTFWLTNEVLKCQTLLTSILL